ncbi:MAG: IS200/IS605 family transposase [Candidatus Kuenenia sp.]|nr:IS200/IS605 family transposase [Candidatus Kuenenia sp.]
MENKEHLKSNNNVVFSCKYHVIWCPKYRRKVLDGEIAIRLKELIQQKALELKSKIIELEVMPNHVHLLVEVDPQFGIHRLVKNIKGYTSRIMRQEFSTLRTRLPSLWTHSYAVLTCGGAPLSVIKKYIENQKGV